MSDKIKFYLPDFYYHFQLNMKLIDLMREHPEWFRDRISVGSVYGSFPGAIWNGGRYMSGITNMENIQSTIQAFNEREVPVRFTFTNCLLEEKHVHDTYCNLIMDCANNGMNEVLVNSPVLEDYFRAKYPDFKYIMSTTRCERDIDKINEACDRYHLVVTDYRDNIDLDFLGKIEKKDRVELLINAYCHPDCQYRPEHYKQLSLDQLTFRNSASFTGCPAMSRSFREALELETVLKADDVYGTYAAAGFSNFKIEGRTLRAQEVIESYAYYLAQPEYADRVRYELSRHCWRQ